MTPRGPDRRDPSSDLMVADTSTELYDFEAAGDLDTDFAETPPDIEVLPDADPVVVFGPERDEPGRSRVVDGVDPRIRARRDAVAEEWMRRRRLYTLLGIVAVTLVLAMLVLLESALFDVDHVDVDGASGDDAAAIRDAAGLGGGDAVWRLDTGSVQRRVAAVPWVASASVSRSLPNRVHVTVTRRIPVAWARSASGVVAVVDQHGRVLSESLERPPGLPELIGAAPAPAPGEELSTTVGPRLVAMLPTAMASRTATVSVARDAITLQLVFGPEVRLGRPDRLEEKVLVAMAVLDALQGEWVPWVDVSVPTAPYAATPTTLPPPTTTTTVAKAATPAITTTPTTTPTTTRGVGR